MQENISRENEYKFSDKGGSMRTKNFIQFFILVIILLTASFVLAQHGGGLRGGGKGMNSPYQKLYDPETIETISGIVESVDKTPPLRGIHFDVNLTVKTEKETIPVHLGPEWYIDRLDTKIEKGDNIKVKGSRATMGGKPVIIAVEVKKGNTVIAIRDNAGIPVWAKEK